MTRIPNIIFVDEDKNTFTKALAKQLCMYGKLKYFYVKKWHK